MIHIPFTLHSRFYTPHPTPYTLSLHPTFNTLHLHPAPHTPHHTPYPHTLHPAPYTLYPTSQTLNPQLSTPNSNRKLCGVAGRHHGERRGNTIPVHRETACTFAP